MCSSDLNDNDAMPTRAQRLKALGHEIVDRYQQTTHGNQGWKRKICLPQNMLANFSKAALDSEQPIQDADVLHCKLGNWFYCVN